MITRPPPTNQSVWKFFAVLGLAFLLLWVQANEQILAARLWAEEASVYLQQASDSNNSLRVLLSPALGYYTLLSRLQAAVLQWVPLNLLGPVSIVLSLSLLSLLWWVIGRQGVQRSPLMLFSLASVLLANGEMLANNLLLNYWYAAGMAAMLFSIPSAAPIPSRGLFTAVVVLAALSGPHAIFLLPVAAGFQFHQGEFRRWIAQWWVRLYGLLAVIQAGYIGWSLVSDNFQTGVAQGGHRFAGWTLVALGQSLGKYNLVYPVYGYLLLDLPTVIQVAAISVLSLAWCWLLWKGSLRLRALVAASLILQSLYLIASIGGAGGPRYAFVVNVLLMLGLADEACWAKGPIVVRRVAVAILAIAILCPMLDQSVRVGKFSQPIWPDWSQAFSQGCATNMDNSEGHCFMAWPIGGTRWVYCPMPVETLSSCIQP